MAAATAAVTQRVNEIRLPPHILPRQPPPVISTSTRKRCSARAAADTAEADLRALQEIAALDRGTVALRRDRVPITETVRSLVPNVSAEADTKGLTLVVDINPLVPAIVGDRVRLQEALKTRRSPRGWLLETGAPRVPRSS